MASSTAPLTSESVLTRGGGETELPLHVHHEFDQRERVERHGSSSLLSHDAQVQLQGSTYPRLTP